MLPKQRRISRKEFPYVLAKGKRYNSPLFLLYVAPISSLGRAVKPSRFSFSVSKKVCKSAVERNKYRRRGYAAVSRYINDIKPGFYYFFSFKKGSVPVNFSNLEGGVKELLSIALVIS